MSDFKLAEAVIAMQTVRTNSRGKLVNLKSIESLKLALEIGYDVLIFDIKGGV